MWADFAVQIPAQQFTQVFLVALGVARSERAPEDADNRTALEQAEIERNARNIASREADDQMATLPGQPAQRRFRIRTANRIKDHINTFACCEGLDTLFEILAGIINAFIRAMLATDGQFLLAGSSGDYPRAHDFAQLNRRQTHTPCRA